MSKSAGRASALVNKGLRALSGFMPPNNEAISDYLLFLASGLGAWAYLR